MNFPKVHFMKAGCLTLVALAAILAGGVMKTLSGSGSSAGSAGSAVTASLVEGVMVILLGMAGVTAIAFLGMVLFAPARDKEDTDKDDGMSSD